MCFLLAFPFPSSFRVWTSPSYPAGGESPTGRDLDFFAFFEREGLSSASSPTPTSTLGRLVLDIFSLGVLISSGDVSRALGLLFSTDLAMSLRSGFALGGESSTNRGTLKGDLKAGGDSASRGGPSSSGISTTCFVGLICLEELPKTSLSLNNWPLARIRPGLNAGSRGSSSSFLLFAALSGVCCTTFGRFSCCLCSKGDLVGKTALPIGALFIPRREFRDFGRSCDELAAFLFRRDAGGT